MKRLLTGSLTILSLIAIASPSFAQDIAMIKHSSTKIEHIQENKMALTNFARNKNQTSPVNLVGIAYQGFLREKGIPSGSKFIYAVKRGDITAETLVQSGIENGRLSPQTLNDTHYLSVVESALKYIDLN